MHIKNLKNKRRSFFSIHFHQFQNNNCHWMFLVALCFAIVVVFFQQNKSHTQSVHFWLIDTGFCFSSDFFKGKKFCCLLFHEKNNDNETMFNVTTHLQLFYTHKQKSFFLLIKMNEWMSYEMNQFESRWNFWKQQIR